MIDLQEHISEAFSDFRYEFTFGMRELDRSEEKYKALPDLPNKDVKYRAALKKDPVRLAGYRTGNRDRQRRWKAKRETPALQNGREP